MIVVFNLNMSIDKFFLIKKFQTGCTYRLNPIVSRCGGKGANVARVLANFTNDYLLMGFCCGNIGKLIIDLLNREKIRNEIIYQCKGESRICISIINRNGVSTDINEDGPVITNSSQNSFIKKFIEISNKCKHLIISGRTPIGVSYDFYKRVFDIAKKNDIKIHVDLTSNILLSCIKFGCDTVKINCKEFEEVSKTVFSKESVLNFYLKYKNYGLQNLIITNRNKNTLAICKDKFYKITPPKIDKVQSEIGAGDSFMAGFVYYKYLGADDILSLKMATAFASSDVLSFGAGSIDKSNIARFLKQVTIN